VTAISPASPLGAPDEPIFRQPSALTLTLRYLRRNKSLVIGLLIVLALTLFTVGGLLTLNPADAYPLRAPVRKPPSIEYPMGTDFFGRNLLVANVVGMWQTALIGLLAGECERNGYILIAPDWAPPFSGKNFDYMGKDHHIITTAVRDASRKFNVDQDRVFAFGRGPTSRSTWR
jgi:hypothetical protein